MNEILATFDPVQTGLTKEIITFGTITVVLLICLLVGNRVKINYEQRHYKNMFLMLIFFGALISAGATFFTWLTTVKLTPVVIRVQDMDTPYGTVDYTDIRNAYYYEDKVTARYAPEKVMKRTQFLIIDEINKKSHALSEENYDIDKIFSLLEKQVKQLPGSKK